MNEQSVYNRLTIFINHLGMTTSDFAKGINVSPGVLANLGNKASNIVYYKIYNAYPLLSPRWLQLGEGEMLRTIATAGIADDAMKCLDGIAEDDYLIIQQKRIKSIIADLFEQRSIVEKQIEHYGAIIEAKDKQINQLLLMIEARDKEIQKIMNMS